MNVLVVCQHYYPEPFRIHEICEALIARGHRVTAVVGRPNYPSGIVPKEYRFFRRRKEIIRGVTVLRCFEIGRRNTKLGLAVNYLSYMLNAIWRLLWLKRDYDVIYAYSTSPVLMSLPASLLRCISGKRLLISILDIWPACLAAMNVREGSGLYAVMKRVSRWVYRKADTLAYSSICFRQYLVKTHGIVVPEENYLPQFADSLFDKAPSHVIHKDRLCLVFAGNIGKVQGVETLVRTAAILREEPIEWHILGDGSNYEACKALAKELEVGERLVFHGRLPLQDMPAYYAMADAMLVSMIDEPYINDTLPGKVQSYMAAGKPILGSIAGETTHIIELSQCGACAPPDDPQAFAEVVLHFMRSDKRVEMSENARRYYECHFSKKAHMDQLESMLLALCEEDAG